MKQNHIGKIILLASICGLNQESSALQSGSAGAIFGSCSQQGALAPLRPKTNIHELLHGKNGYKPVEDAHQDTLNTSDQADQDKAACCEICTGCFGIPFLWILNALYPAPVLCENKVESNKKQ